jgi:hypothetical protein
MTVVRSLRPADMAPAEVLPCLARQGLISANRFGLLYGWVRLSVVILRGVKHGDDLG